MTTETVILFLVLAAIIALLSATVPFLLWRTYKLEDKVEVLDEAVARLMEVAGVGKK